MSPKKMSRRQQRRELRRKQETRGRIITLSVVVVGAMLLAIALIYPTLNAAVPRDPEEISIPEENPRPFANGNSMGNPDSPIKIEEFSDFQCPYCQRWYIETEDQLVKAYVETGIVHFTYRSMGNFISDNIARAGGRIGTESIDAISAAYCAGDQQKFWEYLDMLFANHTGEAVGDYTAGNLKAYAEIINLDMDAFQACFDTEKYKQRALQDAADGQAAGVTGTPAFLITYTVDGQEKQRFIAGAYPFSEFEKQINEALAEMGLE